MATKAQAMSVGELVGLGEILAKSGYFSDARSAAQAVAKILAGHEMGFGPIASMTDIHIIEGKPVVGAHLRAAAIKRSGRYDYRVVRLDRTVCELEFSQTSKPAKVLGTVTVTMDDCVASGVALGRDGKLKANWARHGDDMLFARAVSKGYRRYCPDLSGGVLSYDADELDLPTEDLPAAPVIVAALPSPSPAAIPAPALAPPVVNGCITAAQFTVLDKAFKAGGVVGTEWLKFLGIERFSRLPVSQYHWVRLLALDGADPADLAKSLKINTIADLAEDRIAQMTYQKLSDRVDRLAQAAGMDAAAFSAMVKQSYGIDDPSDLTIDQLLDCEAKLGGQ